MKLATQRDGSRDGTLWVVRRDGCVGTPAPAPFDTLQRALDAWPRAAPVLEAVQVALEAGAVAGHPVDPATLAAPLPRAYEWLDASAFLNHVVLARTARGALPPEDLETNPLMYQGGSGALAGPCEPFLLDDPSLGLDFEAELGVILGDVPLGASEDHALACVRLVTLLNDWTYRNLVPGELAKGFGFLQAKPTTAFAPFVVTPDELGAYWNEGRPDLTVTCSLNGRRVGQLSTRQMHFSFGALVAHAARTRRLTAGTLLGSGTISQDDPHGGFACIAEQRARALVTGGEPHPYLAAGDRVRIEAEAPGLPALRLFGALDLHVTGPQTGPGTPPRAGA